MLTVCARLICDGLRALALFWWWLVPLLNQAYGIVWKALDRRSGHTVALKKCFDAFRNATDAQVRNQGDANEACVCSHSTTYVCVLPLVLQRTFREIMYLQELAGHDNIIRLLNIVRAENDRDIYLVFDYMGTTHTQARANQSHKWAA